MRRCFLAIRIPPLDFSDQLSPLKKLNLKLTVVHPSRYHFTLHFFGNIEEKEVTRVIDELKLDHTGFSIRLGLPGKLPKNSNKARVLYVGVRNGETYLNSLANQVTEQIEVLGFKINRRMFTPHLTIARIRRGTDVAYATELWMRQKFTKIDLDVTNVELLESVQDAEGLKYNALTSFPLETRYDHIESTID